jgi:hypothetical protein
LLRTHFVRIYSLIAASQWTIQIKVSMPAICREYWIAPISETNQPYPQGKVWPINPMSRWRFLSSSRREIVICFSRILVTMMTLCSQKWWMNNMKYWILKTSIYICTGVLSRILIIQNNYCSKCYGPIS